MAKLYITVTMLTLNISVCRKRFCVFINEKQMKLAHSIKSTHLVVRPIPHQSTKSLENQRK